MRSFGPDEAFAGSIPKLYDTYLVPLIFEPFAAEVVESACDRDPCRAYSKWQPAPAWSLASCKHDARKSLHRRHGLESGDAP